MSRSARALHEVLLEKEPSSMTTKQSVFPATILLLFLAGLAGLTTGCGGAGAMDEEADDQASAQEVRSEACDHSDSAACTLSLLPVTNTVKAKASGNWSTPGTWSTGKVPQPGQNVQIPPGLVVTMNAMMPTTGEPIRSVRIDGTLRFATEENTRLFADTLVVNKGGKLLMGESLRPIDASAKAEIVFGGGDIDIALDRAAKGRGLLSHGTVHMFGAPKTAFEELGAGDDAISASRATIRLRTSPTGWRPGDRVLVTGGRYVKRSQAQVNADTFDTQDEVRSIVSIQGNRVTLSSALTDGFHERPHPGMPILIGNLTRNIVLSTDTENVGRMHRRGHTMFMEDPTVSLNNVELQNLGRTSKSRPVTAVVPPAAGATANVRGRYPVHIHEIGPEKAAAKVEGCVVNGSPGWGIVLHSSNALIRNNVTFNVFAAHFVSEAGNERGAFVHNLAVKSTGDQQRGHEKLFAIKDTDGKSIQDDGQNGHAFWLQSRNVAVNENYAVSHADAAFVWFHRHVPQDASYETNLLRTADRDAIRAKLDRFEVPSSVEIDYGNAPITDVHDNTVVASAAVSEVIKASNGQGHDVRSMFFGFRGFNVGRGIRIEYTGHYTFRDTELYAQDDLVTPWTSALAHGNNVVDTAYVNFKLVGWSRPVQLTQKFNGVWSTPAILYVNGTVRLKGAAASEPFDVKSTPTSARKHVWVTSGPAVANILDTPWYEASIHRAVPYNGDMDMTSSYLPPPPTNRSTPTVSLAALQGNRLWALRATVTGTRVDAGGTFSGDASLNVDGYESDWSGETLLARYRGGKVHKEGDKTFIDVPDHVSDRTTGHLRSYASKVELVP